MKERNQRYECTGQDIFEVWGVVVGLMHTATFAKANGQDPLIAMRQHMDYCEHFVSCRQASRIYSACALEAMSQPSLQQK